MRKRPALAANKPIRLFLPPLRHRVRLFELSVDDLAKPDHALNRSIKSLARKTSGACQFILTKDVSNDVGKIDGLDGGYIYCAKTLMALFLHYKQSPVNGVPCVFYVLARKE